MTQIMLYIIIAVMLAVILMLIGKLHIMRKTLREIDEGLNEKLDIDTNTPVSISGLDSYSRKLASDINRELQELKVQENKYAARNNEIKTAVTNIAHDIRTPLTAINGYLELFEKADLSDDERRWMDVIKTRTDNLKELAEELFSYSVACSEVEQLKYEDVCLNESLANVLAGFYALFKNENIDPEVRITDTPVIRKLDRKAFERILSNLFSNIIKYSLGDCVVELDDSGLITLSNKTEGVTNTDVGRLFERFYTVKTAKGSTGLGLSIARLLTEKMNGDIVAKLENDILIIELQFR